MDPTCQGNTYICFGVMTGSSMIEILQYKNATCKPFDKVFGFDSFCGLSEEFFDPFNEKEWVAGTFSIAKKLNTTPEEACRIIHEKVSEHHGNVVFIPGFVQDTINDELLEKYDFGKVSYIECDFDIYSPTYIGLDWLFRNRLVANNAVIYLDDYRYSENSDMIFKMGESLAWKQIIEKYNISVEKLWILGSYPHVSAAYRILDY